MKYNTEIFIFKAKRIHGEKYNYSKVKYKNIKTKVEIICKKHGSFFQTPEHHLRGAGCPYCAGNVKKTTESFIKEAVGKHGMRYDYSKVKYINNRTKVELICKKHGSFFQTPTNHLKGQGCPKCAGNKVLTLNEFISKANDIHNNFYDYSQVDYKNHDTKVNIICPVHGLFTQTPNGHLNGQGCPKCGLIKQVKFRNVEEIKLKAKETFIKKYGVSNPMFLKEIREKHKLILNDPMVRKKSYLTKKRNNSFNTSKGQEKLKKLLLEYFGKDDVVCEYKCKRYPFYVDFYIKSLDLFIELNAHWTHGEHWFNANKDVDIIEEWSSKESDFYEIALNVYTKRDVEKRLFAKKNNLNYVVFWNSDLKDAQEWFNMGCPLGKDWDKEYSWKL